MYIYIIYMRNEIKNKKEIKKENAKVWRQRKALIPGIEKAIQKHRENNI